jgi:hypothetical protein
MHGMAQDHLRVGQRGIVTMAVSAIYQRVAQLNGQRRDNLTGTPGISYRTCVLTEQRREFLQFRGRAGVCGFTVAGHG